VTVGCILRLWSGRVPQVWPAPSSDPDPVPRGMGRNPASKPWSGPVSVTIRRSPVTRDPRAGPVRL